MELELTPDSFDCIADSDHNITHRSIADFDRSIGFHCFLLGSPSNCFNHINSSDNHASLDYCSCNLDRPGSRISQMVGFEPFTEVTFGWQVYVKAMQAC